jgi:NADH-quinone oxidoreductase subunit G
MGKEVTLTIDGKSVTVPAGTLVVDAAKKIGIDIPVFCYHPKMEPVGMCRMCLVEIGRPVIDRASGQMVLEADGRPKVQFGPKLDTSCTTPVSEGMAVVTNSAKAVAGRREIIEFILTSHPLDCPVCDKGGECPLQNLTMTHGSGESRFLFSEKMHLAKHVPLGELIYLDRERCIQCARCVRFQTDVVDDPVIGFNQRGRALEIVTHSEPGFDSYFSGNTTDICPVGALTSADFRFGARPWELKPAASLCSHCPVGCNLTYNVRREAAAGGKLVIKRAMPRQNEQVNEIWMCDKGRFAYHYAESLERLSKPLVRKGETLVEVEWEEALQAAAEGLRKAGQSLVLAGGRLANEDLFILGKLGKPVLYSGCGGGDLVAQVGLGPGSNLGDLGKGSLVLVIASDIHEEAPIWWLRLKAAAKRGARLVVAGARPTRLEKYASQVIRYRYGEEIAALQPFLDGSDPAFTQAENALIFYGNEGLDLAGSNALAQACTELLVRYQHTGRANNGLVGVWANANTQGAWELGFRPSLNLAHDLARAGAVYVAAADPAGDDPTLAEALEKAGFVVVHELFLTETARRADVVLPVQSNLEREGTYTSGERRVQRFYPVIYPPAGARPDFQAAVQVAEKLGLAVEGRAPSLTFLKLAAEVAAYSGLTYQALSAVTEQWPAVGRADLYYGGTSYENKQGLGVQLPASGWKGSLDGKPVAAQATPVVNAGEIWLVPVTRLYDGGQTIRHTHLLDQRAAKPTLRLHPRTASAFGLAEGAPVRVALDESTAVLRIVLDDSIPTGVGLVPRSAGVPDAAPRAVRLHRIEEPVR